MIVELTVENLAIIERSQLRLGPGFTVLTGETGAGKSLLIDAIELALGERADTELVRTGANKANVGVVIDLNKSAVARNRCADLGIELEDGLLYLQREVAVEGRSQCRIAGKLAPVATLKQVGQVLVDLHGQHAHQSLLNAEEHLSYLDAWIGAEAEPIVRAVAEAFEETQEVRRKLHALRAGIRDREQRLDLLRFQVREIEGVQPKVGEYEELETQLQRMKHVEKLANAAFAALEALSDKDDCAVDLAGTALKSLESATKFDETLEAIVTPLQEGLVLLDEATRGLRAYAEALDMDPARLDEFTARLDSLKRLRRKYGENEARILEFMEDAQRQLDALEDSEASEADLLSATEAAEAKLKTAAKVLSRLRKAKAVEFAESVQTELRDLAMDRAVFQVDFKPKEADQNGMDDVQFYFSANAGEPPRPLAKIASGGEISRLMLAMKTALAGKAGVPTLIFDEVDSGLGGRAAVMMGKKLEQLGEHYQVLVISHSPQIASRATCHHRIEKVEVDGRVVTQVRELSDNERVEEIARMLAGEHVTAAVLANARELIGTA